MREKCGFDGRHMAEAASAMRYVMLREEEPSFVIRDPRCANESTNCTSLVFSGRLLVGLEVTAISLVFGQLICILTRLASFCNIIRASRITMQVEQRWRCHPRLTIEI